ncbi:hypothetical protein NIE88_19410 [Sporolactobacillus shoreicorticis]|uniref:Uncharacterized protein n=1 Tax=Sporolactobacillus shoreicorticis TaxID=1923877 RepID=A0ABW5RXS9_9BACL|nr:hypothetical protein [Sporolactobacillus shoreicorticis]MCO7127911.1 hypothetical protein [Sporolactobacillus shoreicorticis]
MTIKLIALNCHLKSQYYLAPRVLKNKEQSIFDEGALSRKKAVSSQGIDLDKYILKNVKLGNFQSYKINDNVSIIFTDDLGYFIEVASEVPSLPVTNNASPLFISLASSSYKNTKTYTYGITRYAYILHQPLYSVGVKGYFSYNKSKVNAHLVDGWYKRATASIWQVSDWHKGSRINSAKHGEVYSEGNFHFGIEYAGIGLILEEQHVKVYIRADKKGKHWHGYSMK